MNQFRRVRIFSGLALALALTLSWQQTTGAKAEEVWQPPLGAPILLVEPFRQPNSDYSAGHRGVDYQVVDGQAIYSPTDAVVHFNQVLVNRPVLSLQTRQGDLIEFEPACGYFTSGTQVSAGDAIGYFCKADPTYKQHCEKVTCLHFSLRTNRGYLSPIVRYGALAPSVLLPNP